jgi:mutual gliding-motility protein MglA
MVFFNYATMQMAAKIVYYGPGLCGKTTNLHYIYQKTSPQSRGEMVSLETETDRTLFFDLLPLDVGVIGGFKTRLQLYTVPGQVFYNTTRKLVLKGADGLVFVADSQKPMLDANIESLNNLRQNLAEIQLELEDIPVVVQLNKRDLPNILSPEEVRRALDPEGKFEMVESSAVTGQGVFETLKLISKLTLKNLRKRMMGDEPTTKAAPIVRERIVPTHEPERPKPPKAVTQPIPAITDDAAPTPVAPAAPAVVAPIAEPRPAPAAPAVAVVEQPPPAPVIAPRPTAPPAAAVAQTSRPAVAPLSPAPPVVTPAPSRPEPSVSAPVPETPAAAAVAAPASAETLEVKHVKVRSSGDVLAELDSLRKKATQGAPRKREASPLDALGAISATPRKTTKSITITPDGETSSQIRRVRMTIQLEDNQRNALHTEEQIIDLSDAQEQVQVTVKIDFGQEN